MIRTGWVSALNSFGALKLSAHSQERHLRVKHLRHLSTQVYFWYIKEESESNWLIEVHVVNGHHNGAGARDEETHP